MGGQAHGLRSQEEPQIRHRGDPGILPECRGLSHIVASLKCA